MSGSEGCEEGDIGSEEFCHGRHFFGSIDADFESGDVCMEGRAGYGEGQPEVVIEISEGGEAVELGGEDEIDSFFGGSFSDTSCDADSFFDFVLSCVCGEFPKGTEAIFDDEDGFFARSTDLLSIHANDGGGIFLESVVDELVSVGGSALEGEEEVAGFEGTRIDADSFWVVDIFGIDNGRSEEFDEGIEIEDMWRVEGGRIVGVDLVPGFYDVGSVIPRRDDVFGGVAIVPHTCDDEGISWIEVLDSFFDGLFSSCDILSFFPGTFHDLFSNESGIFISGVVVGDEDAVSVKLCDFSHFESSGDVAISPGPEEDV